MSLRDIRIRGADIRLPLTVALIEELYRGEGETMKQTKCNNCGKSFTCDNGKWFTTCNCACNYGVAFSSPESSHGSEGPVMSRLEESLQTVITREELIEYFESDHGGKGLRKDFLETCPDARLFRMAELAGASFEKWLFEVKRK